MPFPTKDAPLVITPGFATHWLNGPDSLNIPAQLHEVYTEFRWLPKIGEYFRADVAVQPGYYSDWDGSSTRAVRILGHVSGIYDWTPTFQLVLGAAYLDRPDIEVLPIAGFIWKPDPDCGVSAGVSGAEDLVADSDDRNWIPIDPRSLE